MGDVTFSAMYPGDEEAERVAAMLSKIYEETRGFPLLEWDEERIELNDPKERK